MKASLVSQRRFILSAAVALSVLVGTMALAQPKEKPLRIGVYDSRAIVIAYCNSKECQKLLDSARAEYKKARDNKDEKRVKEIETRMKTQQRRQHEQGYSTGSVANLIATIKGSLPRVARKAGVEMIVSKWEVNYQSSAVQVVDVTDDLVALFHVSARGLEWAKAMKAQTPVPIEQMTDDMD